MTHPGTRRFFLAAAIAYLVFVFYGSFVPLQFHRHSFTEACALFVRPHALRPSYASRSDWAVNFLLLAPVPFLWLCALGPGKGGRTRRALAAMAGWAAAIPVSVAAEFGQAFFPPRDPSLRDVAAQVIGAFAGAVAWWIYGTRMAAGVDRWKRTHGALRLAEWILWPYLAVVAFFSLMPFDFTVSPASLHHKWRLGRIVVVPFAQRLPSVAHEVYAIVTGILLWVPVAALAVLSGRRRSFEIWVLTLFAAAGLECLQVLVLSRVCDITDVVLAGCGAAIGVGIGTVLRRHTAASGPQAPARALTWRRMAAAGIAVWLLVLAFYEWFPFDFHRTLPDLRARIAHLRPPPFTSYFFATPLHALAEMIRKSLFFAPLGAAMAVLLAPYQASRRKGFAVVVAVLSLTLIALILEAGQVFLPSRYPDLSDVILEVVGGAGGFWAARALWQRKRRNQGSVAWTSPSRAHPTNTLPSSDARAEKE